MHTTQHKRSSNHSVHCQTSDRDCGWRYVQHTQKVSFRLISAQPYSCRMVLFLAELITIYSGRMDLPSVLLCGTEIADKPGEKRIPLSVKSTDNCFVSLITIRSLANARGCEFCWIGKRSKLLTSTHSIHHCCFLDFFFCESTIVIRCWSILYKEVATQSRSVDTPFASGTSATGLHTTTH